MGGGSVPAGHGLMAGQVAEIIVTLDGGPGRRGSGYRVGPGSVLTAAHVVEGAVAVRVRFDADLPGEWTAEVLSYWAAPRSDLAVLTIAPRAREPAVVAARFGRIGGDRAAVLAARAVGFPRFKLKTDDGTDADSPRYRDSHQADGSVAVLSNRREGTLELTVPPPEHDPDPAVSPWEGMSGAAVWVRDRIVGVIAKHHRSDGLNRLATTRLDLSLAGSTRTGRPNCALCSACPRCCSTWSRPSTAEWVRTAYQAQVRDIAPDQLLDREAELDELAAFCAGDQPYAWWQAGPWAGKSALMSWFVLHPPAGVDVVSFFVTARLAGQSDSHACTDALIEQFAALLGESPATLLTSGARRGTMLRLLDDAARRLRETGRRLLLVIDGLDEDSGTTTGPSIAALLPRRPPPEVRILVASRPHPPIPDDVPDGHPMRTIVPRRLTISDHARDVERRAKHELAQLLSGSQLQRDLLGLITAAGGGLTLEDLERLTQRPSYEIGYMLGGLFGRSVESLLLSPVVGRLEERVYLFTHETLRLVAQQQFGHGLAAYRDSIHDWADSYRHRGWPADTPQYLLRSYPRMLASSGDLTRLVACATDKDRHDRMRDMTGGDALAFTEINTAQQLILAQPDPGLTNLTLVVVQREHLTERNSSIPVNLPAVWAQIGQPARAEALANSIPRADQRVEALTRLAEVVAASGDHDRVARLAGEAEELIEQISKPDQRDRVLVRLAGAVAASGDHRRAVMFTAKIANLYSREEAFARLAMAAVANNDHYQAEVLAETIVDPDWRAIALTRRAKAVMADGDHARAARLTGEVEALAEQIMDMNWRAETLTQLAEAVAANGDHDRAARLTGEIEGLIGQITDPDRRARALARLAEAIATSGDHARAEVLVGQIIDLNWRAAALTWLAKVVMADGDHDRFSRLTNEAQALIGQITDPGQRARVLAQLAKAVEAGGDHDRAAQLAGEVEVLIRRIMDPNRRAVALTWLAESVATSGDYARAARMAGEVEAFLGKVTGLFRRSGALTRLAIAVSVCGDHARARMLIGQITDPFQRARALTQLAEEVMAGGACDRAVQLVDEAEALIGRVTDPDWGEGMLIRLAEVVMACGDHDRAQMLIGQVTSPFRRARTLSHLAEEVMAGGRGNRDRAARMVSEAEALIAQIINYPVGRAEALAGLAGAVAAGGDHDQAQALIEQITGPLRRSGALGRLARAVAACGDHARARMLIGQIISPFRRVKVLAQLAEEVMARGDYECAIQLVDEAEELTGQIADLDWRAGALARLAEVLAVLGNRERATRLVDEAESFIGQLDGQDRRVEALARLAEEVMATGDRERAIRLVGEAELFVRQITGRNRRAETLARLARILVETAAETSPIPECGHTGSPLTVRARQLFAEALVTSSWIDVVFELASVDPLTVTALADEVQGRWESRPKRLNFPDGD